MKDAKIVRLAGEIEDQLEKAREAISNGSRYRGMSYEDGMIAMYEWLTGQTGDLPIEDD